MNLTRVTMLSVACGFLGGFIANRTSVITVEAADPPVLRTQRLELVTKQGKPVAVLEVQNDSPMLTFVDEWQGIPRRVSLTPAALMMNAGKEIALLAPDTGLMLSPTNGVITLGSNISTGNQPVLSISSPNGVSVLAGVGFSLSDKNAKVRASIELVPPPVGGSMLRFYSSVGANSNNTVRASLGVFGDEAGVIVLNNNQGLPSWMMYGDQK